MLACKMPVLGHDVTCLRVLHGFWLMQITTLGLVYPSLLLIYFGEAAYLGTFPGDYARSYFAAIPQPLFWPMFVVAMASALVGSQSLITSAFSVARQSAVMSCFPPVRVSHSHAPVPVVRPSTGFWVLVHSNVSIILLSLRDM